MTENKSIKRIIISRIDNIGDVIFTLPLTTILKEHFPNCKIYFLARNYVKDIITTCDNIDEFIDWDTLEKQPLQESIQQFKNINASVILHCFPNKQITKIAYKAKIPIRVAHFEKPFNLFYNNRFVYFSRKRSGLHEAQLNLHYLNALDIDVRYTLNDIASLIELHPKAPLPESLAAQLSPNKFKLIIHPGSNGNGREWPASYFADLIQQLPSNQIQLFLSGSREEAQRFQQDIIATCPQVINVMGKISLAEFHTLVSQCDGLVAAGTGPLHIASVQGINTLGLYPPLQSLNPKRWAPVGNKANYLVGKDHCASCSNKIACPCMRAISVGQVKAVILQWAEKRSLTFL